MLGEAHKSFSHYLIAITFLVLLSGTSAFAIPGVAVFGSLTVGPGGVTDYLFQINNARGTPGPVTPSRSGWSLLQVNKANTFSGNLTWAATPTAGHQLQFSIETLLNPT